MKKLLEKKIIILFILKIKNINITDKQYNILLTNNKHIIILIVIILNVPCLVIFLLHILISSNKYHKYRK
jgi:hypothetical protein